MSPGWGANRRGIVTGLVLVALVVLAGCVGSPGATPTATNAPGEDTTPTPMADGGETPMATATPGATATPSGDPAAGESSFGAYNQNLRQASSYTVTYDISVSGSDGGTLSGTVMADLDRETAYQSLNFDDDESSASFEYYQPSGEGYVYTRITSEGQSFYQRSEADQTALMLFAEPTYASGSGAGFAAAPEFRDEGIVNTAEGPRHRYVIDDIDQLPRESTASYEDIRSVNFVILVDERRSLVTDVDYQITYVPAGSDEVVTVDFQLSYTNIGSTTVSEPAWYSEAQQQT